MMSRDYQPTAKQIKAALELLGMTQEQLAVASGIHEVTISQFMRGHQKARKRTLAALQRALQERGIIFSNGDKPSVTLDRSQAVIHV